MGLLENMEDYYWLHPMWIGAWKSSIIVNWNKDIDTYNSCTIWNGPIWSSKGETPPNQWIGRTTPGYLAPHNSNETSKSSMAQQAIQIYKWNKIKYRVITKKHRYSETWLLLIKLMCWTVKNAEWNKFAWMMVLYLWEDMWELHGFTKVHYNDVERKFYHKEEMRKP